MSLSKRSTVETRSWSFSGKLFCLRFASAALLLIPLLTTILIPEQMQRTDFVSSFYIAGHMVCDGKASRLYPEPQSTSLIDTPFSVYAHQMLNKLPTVIVPAFMYSPATALLFSWCGYLSPPVALLTWQVLSILALAFCAMLLTGLSGKQWINYFWNCQLFFPILETMWTGQLGIVLGLLPLSLGFWCLMQKRTILSGLIWSLLVLKPQFLPVVFLPIGALALIGETECLLWFLLGVGVVSIGTIIYFGPDITRNWLHALALSDAIFSSSLYKYPQQLVAAWPAAILQLLPLQFRQVTKLLLYLFAGVVFLHALNKSRSLIKAARSNYLEVLPVIFVLGIFLLPLTSPHFLFYDLSVFALAAMLIYQLPIFQADGDMRRGLFINWLFIDLYFIVRMFVNAQFAQPLVLLLVLSWLYWRTMKIINALIAKQAA